MTYKTLLVCLGLALSAPALAQPVVYAENVVDVNCEIDSTGVMHFHAYYQNGADSMLVFVARSSYYFASYMRTVSMDTNIVVVPGYYTVSATFFMPDGTNVVYITDEVIFSSCTIFSVSLEALTDLECEDDLAPLRMIVESDEGLPMIVTLVSDGEPVLTFETNMSVDSTIMVSSGTYELIVMKYHGPEVEEKTSSEIYAMACVSTGIVEHVQDVVYDIEVFDNSGRFCFTGKQNGMQFPQVLRTHQLGAYTVRYSLGGVPVGTRVFMVL